MDMGIDLLKAQLSLAVLTKNWTAVPYGATVSVGFVSSQNHLITYRITRFVSAATQWDWRHRRNWSYQWEGLVVQAGSVPDVFCSMFFWRDSNLQSPIECRWEHSSICKWMDLGSRSSDRTLDLCIPMNRLKRTTLLWSTVRNYPPFFFFFFFFFNSPLRSSLPIRTCVSQSIWNDFEPEIIPQRFQISFISRTTAIHLNKQSLHIIISLAFLNRKAYRLSKLSIKQ